MPFGQLIIGPPGSGKTTYCNGMLQYLTATGRKVAVINLDPANDMLPYEPAVDVADLVHLESVMEELKLGPNGGLVYCMEYLYQNLDWLEERLRPLIAADTYLLFDCPGQVELFTLHDKFRLLLDTLTGDWGFRLMAVHLVDAHLCTDASKYISALLLSLSTMLHLELPHINVLSKMDLLRQYGDLAMGLDFYTEVQDLGYLVQTMGDDPFSQRYRKLSSSLCEVIEDYQMLSFLPLAIQDRASVARIAALADKANGYVLAGLAGQNPYPAEFIYGAGADTMASDALLDYQEKYVDSDLVIREHDTNEPATANR